MHDFFLLRGRCCISCIYFARHGLIVLNSCVSPSCPGCYRSCTACSGACPQLSTCCCEKMSIKPRWTRSSWSMKNAPTPCRRCVQMKTVFRRFAGLNRIFTKAMTPKNRSPRQRLRSDPPMWTVANSAQIAKIIVDDAIVKMLRN